MKYLDNKIEELNTELLNTDNDLNKIVLLAKIEILKEVKTDILNEIVTL
jgi:hypothetical protein